MRLCWSFLQRPDGPAGRSSITSFARVSHENDVRRLLVVGAFSGGGRLPGGLREIPGPVVELEVLLL